MRSGGQKGSACARQLYEDIVEKHVKRRCAKHVHDWGV